MYLAFLKLCAIAIAMATTQPARVLHIAADPNNLPFSNDRLEGFENKIAALIASDLGAQVEYTWWAQRRGFFRDAVKHGTAELVLGVPADFERVIPTRPYYRFCYVLVYRADRDLRIRSLDDPQLRKLKIGVPLVGGGNNSPPGQALAERKIIDNVVGYSVYADYREENPLSRIISDVGSGEIDVAIVWGPLGGYFAKRASAPLTVVPIESLAFDISVGVKRANPELKKEIEEILVRRKPEIDKILTEYDVPLLPPRTAQQSDAKRSTH